MLDLVWTGSKSKEYSAPLEFLSGYYYGVTGFDISDQLSDCFSPNIQLSAFLAEGMDLLIDKNEQEAFKKLNQFDQLVGTSLQNCPDDIRTEFQVL